jgi:hypothetical protein
MSDGSKLDQRFDALKAIYEQVCDAHNGIADFRAKLLALLPIASGTGIFLLLDEKLPPEAMPHFLPIGIFGVVIASGLFIFELVGIHRCQTLKVVGSALEEKLLETHHQEKLLETHHPIGRFNLGQLRSLTGGTPEQYYGLVKVEVASLTIYSAVIAAWSYVACIDAKFCICELGALKISASVLLASVIIGSLVRRGQKKLLKTASTYVEGTLTNRNP